MTVIDLLQKLVQTPSLSSEEGRAISVVQQAFQTLGLSSTIDENGSLYAIAGPESAPISLLFDGHIDVVPPLTGWTDDPYSAAIKNGRLYGRGSADMKGGVAAAMIALAQANADGNLTQRVAVSVSVLEEIQEGIALDPIIRELSPKNIVICEPSQNRLKTAQRGRTELLLTLFGKNAHAANPEVGINALHLAAKALQTLTQLELINDPEMGRGNLVPTDIISDPYPCNSMLPTSVTIRFDRRTIPSESETYLIDQITQQLKASSITDFELSIVNTPIPTYTGKTLHAKKHLPAWRTDPENPLVQAARSTLRTLQLNDEPSAWPFCTNGSISAGIHQIPTIGIGPGEETQAHTVDESIDIKQLEQCVQIYHRLMQNGAI